MSEITMSADSVAVRWNELGVDPEQAFVLTLARGYALAEEPRATRDALAGIVPGITSWQRVETLLHTHRVRSLAYAVIRQPKVRDSEIVPESVFGGLRDWYSSSFARAVMEPPILRRVIAAFEQADIPAMAIKGLVLGSWLYEDPALREHDDIDLLVPADRGRQADEVMATLGYGSGYRPQLYPGESPATAGYHDPSGGLPVDLSFDPLHIFWQSPAERRTSFDGWWSRRKPVSIGKGWVPTPAPEDQFLQLARHLQFHGYYRLNWSVDLLVLLRRFANEMDWALVRSEAGRHGIRGGIVRTLELLRAVYGIELPDPALQEIQASRLERSLHRRIWPDSLAVPRERPTKAQDGTPIAPRFLSPSGVHPVAGLSLFALDPRRGKYFLYLGQRIVPPRQWLRETYGNGRYLDLLRQHWGGLRSLRQKVRRRNMG